ncbi:LysR substrate-binding domain-containing protein [Roseovarius aestuarii]|nr:LysR substrate-binding domain-containing protein [Roseovarius aestuarii]
MANLRKDAHLLRHLVTFEVASRSQSFTRAAEEMGVTRVAVSRHIADLEANLGKKLFVRGHRDVTLTAAGVALKDSVNPALKQIAEALAQQRAEVGSTRLSVTVTSAFATYWLMPRLVNFAAHYPDTEINLVVSDRYLDLAAESIDIAIRYIPEPDDLETWHPILQETIFPVFSPKYRARKALTCAADLRHESLLYLSGRYRVEARWQHWFQTQGLSPPKEQSGVQVNTYNNMLQAAIEGHGVALAGHPLVDRYLADGSLLKIDSIEPLARDHYYLTCRSQSDSAKMFCAWLAEQISDSSGTPPESFKQTSDPIATN